MLLKSFPPQMTCTMFPEYSSLYLVSFYITATYLVLPSSLGYQKEKLYDEGDILIELTYPPPTYPFHPLPPRRVTIRAAISWGKNHVRRPGRVNSAEVGWQQDLYVPILPSKRKRKWVPI